MGIDLLALQPHKVSRDLSGYVTYIYGPPKVGKTTLASQMPGCLLCAFEPGYNAIPGIIAQDIHTWSEFKQVVRELRKEEVHEKFQSVVIDTLDLAATLCEKFICQKENVDNISDLAYGKGTRMTKLEMETTFRIIVQMGYALFFIGHEKDKTFKKENGEEFNQTVPSLQPSYNEVAVNMADIFAYAHPTLLEDGTNVSMLTLRSLDNSVAAGNRFKYMEAEIPFTYKALSQALVNAINKEQEAIGDDLFTDEPQTYAENTLSFSDLKNDFDGLIATIQHRVTQIDFNNIWAPTIQSIVTKHLGKGKTVASMDASQADTLQLIVDELSEEVNKMD